MNALIFLQSAEPPVSYVIFGLLVISLLILIAYLIYKNNIIEKEQKPTKPSPDEDTLEAVLLAKERSWFTQYVNGANPKYRTVTLNQAIIQVGIITNKMRAWRERTRTDNLTHVTGQENGSSLLRAQMDTFSDNDAPCTYTAFNSPQLTANETAYENYLLNVLGLQNVGLVCPCGAVSAATENEDDDTVPLTYCDWESDMLTSFMVDLTRWNLQSVDIFLCEELIKETSTKVWSVLPISSSGTLGVDFSPSGQFAHFTMSNESILSGLEDGTLIKIKFKWLELVDGVSVLRCAELENIIKVEDTVSPTVSAPDNTPEEVS